MWQRFNIILLVSLCVLLLACQSQKNTDNSKDKGEVKDSSVVTTAVQKPAVAKPDIAKPSAEIIEKCKLFVPPWGDQNWSEWWQANPELGEKWFGEVQGKMKNADLQVISKCTHITNMLVGFAPLKDLKVFSGLTQLKRLDIRFALEVTDLQPLAGLKNLEYLSIWSTSVSDLSPLTGLDKLKVIIARMTKITDLSPLAKMKALESIDLLKTDVLDISPLAKVKNIKEILLCTTGVADLSPVYSVAEKITYLDLCNTPFRKFEDIKKFKNLKILKLWGMSLGSLDFIKALPNIEELDLSETSFKSLKPLYSLKKLKKLTMLSVKNKPEEIAELKRLHPNLELLLAFD